MYAESGMFFIKNLGDKKWVKPDHFPDSISVIFQNARQPTFVPGGFSFVQYTEEPRLYYDQDRIRKDLYMWRATFNFADLYDIRVTEYKSGPVAHNFDYRISTSAAENDKKHDDLSEWDPWVLYPWLTKN